MCIRIRKTDIHIVQIVGPQGAAIAPSEISLVIDSLKKKVDADRCVYIMVSLRTTQMHNMLLLV